MSPSSIARMLIIGTTVFGFEIKIMYKLSWRLGPPELFIHDLYFKAKYTRANYQREEREMERQSTLSLSLSLRKITKHHFI